MHVYSLGCSSNIKQYLINRIGCYRYAPLQLYLLFAVPNTAIVVSTIIVSAPSLGQIVRIRCVISEAVSGLSNRPVAQWLDDVGSNVVIGDGVSLDGPSSQPSLTTLTLVFNTLHTSHAGTYVCQGSLSSPALFSPLVKAEDYNIIVQSELLCSTLTSRSVFTSFTRYSVYSVLDVKVNTSCVRVLGMEDITSLFTPPHIIMPCGVCYM